MDHLLPWLRLQFTPGLGRAGLIRLIEHYETPTERARCRGRRLAKAAGIA